jgi:hypothetical protein
VGDPVASSLSLLVVSNEPPGVSICCVSVDEDGFVSVLINVLSVGELLATMADQSELPGRHCGPC